MRSVVNTYLLANVCHDCKLAKTREKEVFAEAWYTCAEICFRTAKAPKVWWGCRNIVVERVSQCALGLRPSRWCAAHAYVLSFAQVGFLCFLSYRVQTYFPLLRDTAEFSGVVAAQVSRQHIYVGVYGTPWLLEWYMVCTMHRQLAHPPGTKQMTNTTISFFQLFFLLGWCKY